MISEINSMRSEMLYVLSGVMCIAALLSGGCRSGGQDAGSTCGEVKASAFGWNGTNATAALQAAVDSGAGRVVVDRQAGDWIVEPVFLRRSNQEIVVEDGVAVRAMKGVFKHRNDCLFTIPGCVSNVTLRGEGKATLAMNKDDYRNLDVYGFSEWRHCVSILGARDVVVRDLTILSSGGDGLYVRDAAQNVRLERLVCRDHYRQGLSVISAVGLFVKDCLFGETEGTPPQCGVDLEPNGPLDRLENVVFEDCVFEGNAASGILLALVQMDGTTRPISVTFRRCAARGNGHHGIMFHCTKPAGRTVRGSVVFEDCAVAGNRARALAVLNKRSDALDILFRNCVLDARDSEEHAVRFDNGSYCLLADFGGIEFDNVRILAGKGDPMTFDGVSGVGIAAETMKGSAIVAKPDGAECEVSLREFSRAYPPDPEMLKSVLDFKTVTPDFRTLRAASSGGQLPEAVSTGYLRGKFTFVQYVPAAGDYPVVFRTRPIRSAFQISKSKTGALLKVQVSDALGTDMGAFKVADAVFTNVIHATGAGIRRFAVSVESGLGAVESAWPGHGLLADAYVHLFGGDGRRFFFDVPPGTDPVRVVVKPEEPCSARLVRPDGRVAAEMEYGGKLAKLEAERAESDKGGTWSIEFPRVDEDLEFRIGAPALPLAAPDAAAVMRGR